MNIYTVPNKVEIDVKVKSVEDNIWLQAIATTYWDLVVQLSMVAKSIVNNKYEWHTMYGLRDPGEEKKMLKKWEFMKSQRKLFLDALKSNCSVLKTAKDLSATDNLRMQRRITKQLLLVEESFFTVHEAMLEWQKKRIQWWKCIQCGTLNLESMNCCQHCDEDRGKDCHTVGLDALESEDDQKQVYE